MIAYRASSSITLRKRSLHDQSLPSMCAAYMKTVRLQTSPRHSQPLMSCRHRARRASLPLLWAWYLPMCTGCAAALYKLTCLRVGRRPLPARRHASRVPRRAQEPTEAAGRADYPDVWRFRKRRVGYIEWHEGPGGALSYILSVD